MEPRLFNTFGKRVRILRQDLKMTQGTLAEELGRRGVDISQSYLSTLEGSDRIPSGEVVAALADVLGTTADYLLMRTDDPVSPSSVPSSRDETPEILLLYDRLSPSRRRDLTRQADLWLREESEDYVLELFRDLLASYREQGIEEDAERIIDELLSRYGGRANHGR